MELFRQILYIAAGFLVLFLLLKLLFFALFVGLVLAAGGALYLAIRNGFRRRD